MSELRVVRRTDSFDAACDFYGRTLGWPLDRSWPAAAGQGRGCLFATGTARIELLEVDRAEPVSGVFVAVEVDDVDQLYRRCLDHGRPVADPPADTPWGHRSITLTDPTGLQLSAFHVLVR